MTGVLEEHLGYSADTTRNAHYRSAIARIVRPDDVVVDLGCGFGILGLMCLEAGAARVYGIDETVAAVIARETAERAGYGDRYCCIRESSFRAVLPEMADVLICDHVGFFGFDYGIVALIDDARRRFLKPGGRIAPGRLDLFVAGIESTACRAAADAWAAPQIPAHFHWLRDYGVNAKHPRMLKGSEISTETGALLSIDFTHGTPDQLCGGVTVSASRDGALDGIGGWFRAMLAPDVAMTNSPVADDAINREQVFLPFAEPLPIVAGDSVSLEIRAHHHSGIIAWTAQNRRSGERRAHTTWRSKILTERERSVDVGQPSLLGPIGEAVRAVAERIDGRRSAAQIEQDILERFPVLFPSEEEIRSFVRGQLARLAR